MALGRGAIIVSTSWRAATNVLGTIWAVSLFVMIWRLPEVASPWMPLSLVFPAYYLVLSAKLSAEERRHVPAA